MKLKKHDQYVKELYEQLRHRYDYLSANVPIINSKRILGDIDIYAVKGDRIDLYEVKCSYRIHKAKHQLQKVRRFLNNPEGENYFYCGTSKVLEQVTI
ncbi:hypothetical protein D6764_00880 [Candidatus Woesearchaeota archaeon]|nr:MAG: hypothetical protein D6764_00880 [Candidatus Woesearchaeota archaeon]